MGSSEEQCFKASMNAVFTITANYVETDVGKFL
jgi:hypothetical protein